MSKLEALMPGVGFTVPTTTQNVAVENSALPVSGVLQQAHQIMASKYDLLSIIAPPGKAVEAGIPI